MNGASWKVAANARALEIIEREGVQGETGCIYLSRSHTGGRPSFGIAGRKLTVANAVAMPGKGQHTRHLCHDEACVNPSHLLVGTPSENACDAYDVGSLKRGAEHPRAVHFAPGEIEQIRNDTRSQAVIAKAWGIAQSTVGQIRRGEGRWADE